MAFLASDPRQKVRGADKHKFCDWLKWSLQPLSISLVAASRRAVEHMDPHHTVLPVVQQSMFLCLTVAQQHKCSNAPWAELYDVVRTAEWLV